MLRSIGKTVRGVSPGEEKNGCGGKDLQKRKFALLKMVRISKY